MIKHSTKLVIFALSVALLLTLGFFWLSSSHWANSYLEQNVVDQLNAAVEPHVVSITLQIEEQCKKVRTMAQYMGENGELGGPEHLSLMRIAVEQNGLLHCALSMEDGSFITHDGKTGDATGEVFYHEAMAGNFHISDPRSGVVDAAQQVILFTSPVVQDGKRCGALTYAYPCDDIDRIFNLGLMNGQGQMAIIKSSGQVLISHPNGFTLGSNALTDIVDRCSHSNHQMESCLPTQLTAQAGAATITGLRRAEDLVVTYSRLNYSDWYLLAYAPIKVVKESTVTISNLRRNILILTIGVVGVCLILFFWIRFYRRNNHDELTQSPRQETFVQTAYRLIRKNKDRRFIVIKLDIKDFKLINRVYSFKEGDRVIKNMAQALRVALTGMDASFARAEGDAFWVMLPFENRVLLDSTRQVFINTFRELMGPTFTTIVRFPTGQYITDHHDAANCNMRDILEKVNFAHSMAKRQEHDSIVDYEENIAHEALIQKEIEDKMDDALKNMDYQLYLQAKFCVSTQKMCGAEALVRWTVCGVSVMHPTEFIPALERNGFIVKLDMYMLERAVCLLRSQLDEGKQPVPISVNFSRHHLDNTRFVDMLCSIVDGYRVPRHLVEVELTESVVFSNVDRMVEILGELHKAGFRMAMDDFGSGYSSLALLKDLPVDIIKIDQGFFNTSSDQQRSEIVLRHIQQMAQELQAQTVAEGVETKEQVELLAGIGCDVVQGFYFARPIPAEEFDKRFFGETDSQTVQQ